MKIRRLRPGTGQNVFSSIDYSAIELCTLAQSCLRLIGRSDMADLINSTGDPGSLHTKLGARMLGVSFEEMRARVKAKEPVAMAFRQAGKPGNFGYGGGMGAATMVLTNRKSNAGVTPCPNGPVVIDDKGTMGYVGIRFCILMAGAERCGIEKITSWKNRDYAPVCRHCVELAEELKVGFNTEWSEMKDYHRFANEQLDLTGRIVQIGSERVRAVEGFSQSANGYFQGLAADGAKAALYAVSKECYLDKASPMYGARPIFFNHDEIFSEIPLSIASNAAKRMTKVMVDTMRLHVPDVAIAASPALMWRWSKSAAEVYDIDGNLLPDPETL